VIDGEVKFLVGSPSAFRWLKPGPHILGTGLIPASAFIFPLFPFGLGDWNGSLEHAFYALGIPPHQIREFVVGLNGFAAQFLRGSGSFPLEHRPQTEKIKSDRFRVFRTNLPLAPVQGMAFLRMAIPCLHLLRR
jgi:hypothetical protein